MNEHSSLLEDEAQSVLLEQIRQAQSARRKITIGWVLAIITAIGALFAVANELSKPQGDRDIIAVIFIAPYMVWSIYWGVPVVWRGLVEKFGSLLPAIPVVLFVGYIYGALGGAIYQYIKHRRIAATLPLNASGPEALSPAQMSPPLNDP